jgi:hypothetical protein
MTQQLSYSSIPVEDIGEVNLNAGFEIANNVLFEIIINENECE